ncbi:SWIM zinc finger family protein [Streptomyces sp. NPDC002784]
MTPRPSEEARRALRAAREREARDGGASGADVGEGGGPGGEDRPVTGLSEEGGRVLRPEPMGMGGEFGDVKRPAGELSEAARRALRMAREREGKSAAKGERSGGSGPAMTGTDTREARPGDVARAALRRAGAGDGPDPAGDTGAGTPGTASADPPAARPADVAREALRAARRAEPNPATPVPGRARHPRPARSDAPAARARALRELLSGAFRLPADADSPEEKPTETGDTGRDSRPRTPDAPDADPMPPNPPAPSQGSASAGTHDADRLHADAHADTRGADRAAPEPPADARGAGPTVPDLHAVPRSMAAPSRDGDHRRTFPALPAGGAGGTGFAETWWGNAWVAALEEGALDPKRLARGRGYAEQGHVDAITVTPGLVLAYVKGSRPRPYRVQVRLRTLDDADWERFLDVAVERPGHIAALLDKEMPHSLAECGVPLLPGPGDLEPQCSCPDHGHPCKHAAALCYQTARLLDADPFVLLLLRGRGERELLDALSRLSAARAARAAQDQGPAPLPGVRASDALAPRELPPLPPPLPVPPHPEQPPVYPAAPGGPDPFALDQLATDAAARAHALLGTGHDPLAELTLWQDAVRLAAARPGAGLTAGTRALYASLASAAGRTPADLARAVAAWRQGGEQGLAVLEEAWDPPAGRFDRARPLLLAADLPAFRPWRNRLTHPRGHVQLRLGRDGLWYAYESEPGHDDWWPRGTPDLDPVGALTGLGGPVGP